MIGNLSVSQLIRNLQVTGCSLEEMCFRWNEMSFWYGDYTEEEQRGVEKFLVHRFVVGMICVGVMLVL